MTSRAIVELICRVSFSTVVAVVCFVAAVYVPSQATALNVAGAAVLGMLATYITGWMRPSPLPTTVMEQTTTTVATSEITPPKRIE